MPLSLADFCAGPGAGRGGSGSVGEDGPPFLLFPVLVLLPQDQAVWSAPHERGELRVSQRSPPLPAFPGRRLVLQKCLFTSCNKTVFQSITPVSLRNGSRMVLPIVEKQRVLCQPVPAHRRLPRLPGQGGAVPETPTSTEPLRLSLLLGVLELRGPQDGWRPFVQPGASSFKSSPAPFFIPAGCLRLDPLLSDLTQGTPTRVLRVYS